jgi:hypothetical protein
LSKLAGRLPPIVNPREKITDKQRYLIQVGLQEPMPAIDEMKFGVRQVAEICSGRFLRHVVVVGSPDEYPSGEGRLAELG